jgi:hypothetical protein
MSKSWSWIRIIHIVVAVVLLGAAFIYGNNIFLYILGGGFLAQALLNVGCSNGSCHKPTHFNYRRRH